MDLYENLRVIREERGYTQKQIADFLQTTRQYYNEYENGKREIPIRIYVKLSKFYNVSIDYLAGQDQRPTSKENDEMGNISIKQENNLNAIGILHIEERKK